MRFADIKGNADVVRALVGMVDSGRVPHAIMLHEDDGGGAMPLALAFLQYLYCRDRNGGDSCGECPRCSKISKLIHPDVHFIHPIVVKKDTTSLSYVADFRSLVLSNPCFTETELGEALGFEGKSTLIPVAEARSILDSLALSALEGGWRSVIIYLPEKMNQDASNRLLKMIEEPPSQTQFLLITHAPEKVLSTISSRCQTIRVRPSGASKDVSGESVGLYAELWASLMNALTARDLLAALEVGDSLAALPSRESAKAFCRFAVSQLRLMFLERQHLDALAPGTDPQTALWTSKVKPTFPRLASEAFDRARSLVERNVNAKILFADLVGKLYTLV